MHKFARIVILLASCLGGCATLPDIDPWLAYGGAQPADASAIRKPLTKSQSDAIISKIAARGDDDDILRRQAALEEAVAGQPLVAGNGVQLLHDGPASYKSMFEAIERARDHVNLEYYSVEDDEIGQQLAELLLRKRSQGVAVNLIFDGVGSINTPREYFARLREAGVNVLEFNPVNPLTAKRGWRLNNRDHRKVAIVDGRVAFTGGINISGVYSAGSAAGSVAGSKPREKSTAREKAKEPGWRDTNVRIEGPVVAEMQRLYLAQWEKQGGKPPEARNWFPALKPGGRLPVRVIPSSRDDSVPAIYVTLVSAIRNATRSVYITMAYFAPDPQTLEEIKAAAQRGVDVKLMLPSFTDFWAIFHAGRSHYSDLLEAGIEIYERQEALLHAKTAVIDGVWSTVGSSNIDWRSFLHNDELNVVVLGQEFGARMQDDFRRDLANCRRITREEWERRPLTDRIMEQAARVWEHWL